MNHNKQPMQLYLHPENLQFTQRQPGRTSGLSPDEKNFAICGLHFDKVHHRGRSAHASRDIHLDQSNLFLPKPVIDTVRRMPVAGGDAIAVERRRADLKPSRRCIGIPIVVFATIDGVVIVVDAHGPSHPREI